MKRRDLLLSALGLVIVWQVFAMIVSRPILPAPWEVFIVFFQESVLSLIFLDEVVKL